MGGKQIHQSVGEVAGSGWRENGRRNVQNPTENLSPVESSIISVTECISSLILVLVLRTKNHLLTQGLGELLRKERFSDRRKLSPDCPLVEVLKESRDDRLKLKPCSPG